MLASLRRLLLGLALIGAGLALGTPPVHAAPVTAVASFSILADLVREVGGDRITVHALVGPDEDAHGYQPRPSDARTVREARLVVVNGLGFDTWLSRLAGSEGHASTLVVASEGIETIDENPDHAHHHGHDHDHEQGDATARTPDPHAWQDVSRARIYVRNIAAALAQADPEGASEYAANAERYDRTLQQLDDEIRSTLARLTPERRKLVTSHDAFAYFGAAYGMRVVAAAGVSMESEPSAAGIARLIRQLRKEKVPAVFVENISDPRLIERIAREGGARIGGRLHSDALSGEAGPATTYIDLMRANLRTIIEGLTPHDG
ncbi:MAG: zinc ABC transporter substrate-binding protein [Rhodocyclaceae bacterium]|jgi:zinc/manganese transport system substrate-binding protein|nr:zinc ABC transporter substrate-binding protein [Rhodocyclaceae bacterium]